MTGSIQNWSEPEIRAIREQLDRMLGSTVFKYSERLSRFLRFIVIETLEGRGGRLNQFAIAVEVFDRDETFDPTVDAIVRVEAGRLRSKLMEFYSDSQDAEAVQIALPKRTYVVTFDFKSGVAAETKASGRSDIQPVIAVLPFANMSQDTEQEYFADGITEDLITDLSKLSGVGVIARHSTFRYKGKDISVQAVCDELGANVVLEGSVRKRGNHVRITAQLIEGKSGQHLWAQRYDSKLCDIFTLQDEINRKIISALAIQLSPTEDARLRHRGTWVVEAHDYLLRGIKEEQDSSLEGAVRAQYCFERALELDPNYATAYAYLSLNATFRWISSWDKSREKTIDKGLELAKKAVALDGQLAIAHAALGWVFLWQGEHDKAIFEGKLAITLDPNEVVALERLGLSMIFSGDATPSLALIDKAKRLNPNHTYDFARGIAMFMLADYEKAIKLLQKSVDQKPNFIPSSLYLASSQALLGLNSEAVATVTNIGKIRPGYTFSTDFQSHFKNAEDYERFSEGLKIASLI